MEISGDHRWLPVETGVVAGGDHGFVLDVEWVVNRWICLVLKWVLRVVIVNGEFVLVLGSIWCSC